MKRAKVSHVEGDFTASQELANAAAVIGTRALFIASFRSARYESQLAVSAG